jgi:hypothetical protein
MRAAASPLFERRETNTLACTPLVSYSIRNPEMGPGDDELLDLLGALEDVEGVPESCGDSPPVRQQRRGSARRRGSAPTGRVLVPTSYLSPGPGGSTSSRLGNVRYSLKTTARIPASLSDRSVARPPRLETAPICE